MKPFIFLLFLVSIAYANLLNGMEPQFFDIKIDRDHPDKLYKEFDDFIVKFKKNYTNSAEKSFRFNQFVGNRNSIEKMKSAAEKKGSDIKLGINKFGDMSKEEFQNTLSKIPPGNYSNLKMFNLRQIRAKRGLDNLPNSFDLRNKKIGGKYVIGPVKNQGKCGCCWAFAATTVAEVALSVHTKETKSLSDQEVCDCGSTTDPGCVGGDPTLGLQYISRMGQTLESNYPYVDGHSDKLGMCVADEYSRELDAMELDLYRIDPFNAEYQIMRHLFYLNTPVAVAFRTGQAFEFLEGGVLELPDCDQETNAVWHSAAIIGYGTTKNSKGRNVDYWILKNSWDTDWGEDGYARIVRGENWCDIESQATGARISA